LRKILFFQESTASNQAKCTFKNNFAIIQLCGHDAVRFQGRISVTWCFKRTQENVSGGQIRWRIWNAQAIFFNPKKFVRFGGVLITILKKLRIIDSH